MYRWVMGRRSNQLGLPAVGLDFPSGAASQWCASSASSLRGSGPESYLLLLENYDHRSLGPQQSIQQLIFCCLDTP